MVHHRLLPPHCSFLQTHSISLQIDQDFRQLDHFLSIFEL